MVSSRSTAAGGMERRGAYALFALSLCAGAFAEPVPTLEETLARLSCYNVPDNCTCEDIEIFYDESITGTIPSGLGQCTNLTTLCVALSEPSDKAADTHSSVARVAEPSEAVTRITT